MSFTDHVYVSIPLLLLYVLALVLTVLFVEIVLTLLKLLIQWLRSFISERYRVSNLPSFDTVVEKLNEIVNEYGADHVYEKHSDSDVSRCLYVWKGEPDCIIGKLLVKLGFTVGNLYSIEGESAAEAFNKLYGLDIDMLRRRDWPKVIQLVWDVQSRQDGGMPWGRAVSEGIANVNGTSTLAD
jgi:hypothetical protein